MVRNRLLEFVERQVGLALSHPAEDLDGRFALREECAAARVPATESPARRDRHRVSEALPVPLLPKLTHFGESGFGLGRQDAGRGEEQGRDHQESVPRTVLP